MRRLELAVRLAARNLRRRPGQALLLLLTLTIATGVLGVAMSLYGSADEPWNRVWRANKGFQVSFTVYHAPDEPGDRALVAELRQRTGQLTRAPGVVAVGGPWTHLYGSIQIAGGTEDLTAEVRDPGRVIPRSILISTAAVALIYIGINLSIIGVVPWREFVPASAHPESSFIVSYFMQTIYGSGVATIFTLLVLWTAFGSTFALLLGYSRIPFAAAQSGYFFPVFGRLHRTKDFPYVSLLVLGAISIVAGFFSLGTVIDALIVTRILVQFMGQAFGLMLLRRHAPDLPRPFRMWLYPIPALVALLGWMFVFATTPPKVMAFGVGLLAVGCLTFLLWSWRTNRWPFQLAEVA